MNQSNQAFESDTRKTTAKRHLRQTDADTDDGVRPTYRFGVIENRNWHEAPYSSLAGFFEYCQWHRFFPESVPDVFNTVVLNRRDSSVFHRIREYEADQDRWIVRENQALHRRGGAK